MRVENILAYEQDFDNTGIDSQGKKHRFLQQQIEIPGENANMNYVLAQPVSGDRSYYYNTQLKKDQIVIHFTMGYLKGDIGTLTKPDYHVSVPFVIGRNGTIYNLFSSNLWSYHLGRGAVGGNQKRSKATIGIELSNIGGLKKTSRGMATYYNDIYCDVNQSQYYQRESFRNFDCFATFTDAQYEALIILLRYLTARFNITRKFLPENLRYETFNDVVNFGGIVTHVNYRSDGKVDIGPAFDWERVIAGVS